MLRGFFTAIPSGERCANIWSKPSDTLPKSSWEPDENMSESEPIRHLIDLNATHVADLTFILSEAAKHFENAGLVGEKDVAPHGGV